MAYGEYSHVSKIAKKSRNADKREFMNMLTTETEEAAHQENLLELYTTIRKLSGKFGKPERPLNDKGGKPIPDEGGQKERWMEQFEELLNRPAPQDPPEIPPANDDLPIDCDPLHFHFWDSKKNATLHDEMNRNVSSLLWQ